MTIFFCLLSQPLCAATAVGTETVLGKFFSVNLHMDNCCEGNYGSTDQVIKEIRYIGARRARDWATNDDVVNSWKKINAETGITFHASIPQTSPEKQRRALRRIENWLAQYPGLIHTIEGSNEPDTAYPKSQGASLEDSAALQHDVYKVGKEAGVRVAQLSVGGGWKAPLWEGNYKAFGKPPADYGNAHVYMTKNSPPSISLKRIGELAEYSTPDKPVDITEFGTYKANQDDETASAFIHMAPFASYLMGHAGLSVYALHDDMSGIVGFYDSDGKKRAMADYWHHTTKLLSDPEGKNLPPKDIDITFTNQKSSGKAPLGIKNIMMYKSDGSMWIASFNEDHMGAADSLQTVVFDKVYPIVRLYDARSGSIMNEYMDINRLDIALPANHVLLLQLSSK